LEDVIDVMHALYVEEDTVIIREGEKGESFYILEEGMYVCIYVCVFDVDIDESER
jgi:CRP-like cAMP-binding protein